MSCRSDTSSSSDSSSSSESSSSSQGVVADAMEVEPAAPPSPAETRASSTCTVRGEVLADMGYEGGRIAVYRNGNFAAYCSNPAHGRCILTRVRHAGRKKAQGRPCGLLAAWLALSDDPAITTKKAHMDSSNLPGFDARLHHRTNLGTIPGNEDLLSYERPVREGEGPEPEARP